MVPCGPDHVSIQVKFMYLLGNHIVDFTTPITEANVVLDSLLENGLTLTSADKAAKSVLELLAAWRPKKRYLRADRLGWTDGSFNAFVMGSSRVIGETPVVVSGASTDIETAIHANGALDDWRKEVSALCEGNTPASRSRSKAVPRGRSRLGRRR
jgi:uncharacterized protein (DUF927 family)